MKDVKLCTDCKFRAAASAGGGFHWCGAWPEEKTLKAARDKCKGNDWQRGSRVRLHTAQDLYR